VLAKGEHKASFSDRSDASDATEAVGITLDHVCSPAQYVPMTDEPAKRETLPLTEEDWKRHRDSVKTIHAVSAMFIGGGILTTFMGFGVVKTLIASGTWFVLGIAGLMLARHEESGPPTRRLKLSLQRVRKAHIRTGAFSVALVSVGVVVGTLWRWDWGGYIVFVGGAVLVALVVERVKLAVAERKKTRRKGELEAEEHEDWVPPPPPERKPAKLWHIALGLILVVVALAAGVWSLAVRSEFGAGPIVFAVVLALRIGHDWRMRNTLIRKAE